MRGMAMASSTASRGWHNWLRYFDNWARTLPRFKSWDTNSYFLFARHPSLQPSTPKRKAHSKHELSLQDDRDFFEETLADWQGKIQSRGSAQKTLCGLRVPQRRQLAAMVIDIYTELDEYLRLRFGRDHYRELISERGRRQRMREGKLKQARRALENLIRYENRLPREFRGTRVPASGALLRKSSRQCAESALAQLPEVAPPLPDFRPVLDHPALPSFPKYPVPFCLVRLFWFFRYDCKLPLTESCIRAGLLFNSFAPAGIRHVKVYDTYEDAESPRCPAVYQVAKRFKLPTH